MFFDLISNSYFLFEYRKNTKNLSEYNFSCFFDFTEIFPIFALHK